MTISTTIIKNSYSGDASNDTFAYQFKISTTADMEVIIRSAAGAETVKTLTTHYTVTGAGTASGGNVVFESGAIPSATETVILRRSTTQTQALDLVENDPFTADSVESAFDKNLALVQELQEESNRSLKISRTNTMTSTEFTNSATDRASKVLAFDADGELSVTQELGTYEGTSATTTTAAFVLRDLVKGSTTAQLNNIYICIKASPIGTALTNTTYWVLIVDAVSAATSATTATTKAAAAASSATAAAASETAAETAETNAETAETNAAASYDSFDDRYLGSKSSAPSVDNDGGSLLTGALYFNTSDNTMYSYTGSAWVSLKPSSAEQTAINALGASAVVTDMGILATTDIVADMAILGTSDVVADMAILATSDVVTDMNTLGTAAIVTDMDLLATSANVTAMGVLGTAAVVEDMGILGTSANVTAMSTVSSNVDGVNSFAERYRVTSGDPGSSLNAGDLNYNTSSNALKYYNGSAWSSIGVNTDESAKVSANDSTAGFLNGKLVAGNKITFTENNNGSNETLTIAALGGIEWQSVITGATVNVTAGKGYFVNTASNACTATLPSSPSLGEEIRFIDYGATFDTNALTIARNGKYIQGANSDLVVSTERAAFGLVFVDNTQGWLLTEK